ncbi:MAG TPA: M28 family peptidase, partial [Elusimicrobiota bacterium]|nr:M28 family peptidase [Elusimicrobiota bacterium]
MIQVLAALLLAAPCRAADPALQPALAALSGDDILARIKVLASDEFEGRAPGSKGEDLTVAYLQREFKRLGLKPGNPDGTYIQKVPLVGIKGAPEASFTGKSATFVPRFTEDAVAVSERAVGEVSVKGSELVFVGYGITAPEYGWDDFKGADLKGKTLVFLINDPPLPDPKDPAKLDEKMFKGKAMTYYGRWTYKYEKAAELGAAAAIIVHETEAAAYPWSVVQNSWSGENFSLKTDDKNAGVVAVQSWVSSGTAVRLLAMAGQDYWQLKRKALDRAFKPIPLGITADFTIQNSLREVLSRNVVARIPGSDPKLKAETVVYTAHWDHLGKDPKLKGDQIFNGALDNASGTSALLELAKAFSTLKPAPKRSVLFIALTGEEQGLLGAKHYAEHPLYPLTKTLAEINMDVINVYGPTKDIVSGGLGQSTLDETLIAAAAARGRAVKGDPEPEKGGFFRSDHFEFVKKGVPALEY